MLFRFKYGFTSILEGEFSATEFESSVPTVTDDESPFPTKPDIGIVALIGTRFEVMLGLSLAGLSSITGGSLTGVLPPSLILLVDILILGLVLGPTLPSEL